MCGGLRFCAAHCLCEARCSWHAPVLLSNSRPVNRPGLGAFAQSSSACLGAGKLKWAQFGPTCIKLYELKLGIIRGIISEHDVAMRTVIKRFQTRYVTRVSKTKLILAEPLQRRKGEPADSARRFFNIPGSAAKELCRVRSFDSSEERLMPR